MFKDKYKKILGFDSWAKGAHHFSRLVPVLEERSISLTLVHLGSWGNEPNCLAEEHIGKLLVRDISFYGSDDFEKILDIEQPDAVVLLSTDTFAHRAFIRYCKKRKIPTLNLYHGLVNVQITDDEIGSYTIDRSAHAKVVISKLGKLIKHTLPCYCKALQKTNAKHREWLRFASDILRMASGKITIIAADDAKTSKCAVYTNADVEHAMRTYGFKAEEVIVVGNPDLPGFGLEQSMFGCWESQANGDNNAVVLYIDCGLVSAGLMFNGLQAFCDHLISTSQALAALGIKMRFKPKPHPRYIYDYLVKNLNDSEIELVSNENFLSKLQECSACIVETTTLALVPALMGMPLLYANYNQLNLLRFGPVLMSYPRGYLLHDVSDVSDILRKDIADFDRNKLNEWIGFNAGPLPAEKMPTRVADILVQMLHVSA